MKVLFLYVSTNMCRDGDLWFYDEGTASVAAALRARGHGVAFRMVAPGESVADLLPWIDEHREERTLAVFHTSLLFSAYAHDVPDTFAGVRDLKQVTGLPTLFAGIWATLNAERVVRDPGIDRVGLGEMDRALPDLCDASDANRPLHRIPGFWTLQDGEVRRNRLPRLVSDLSTLPFPARDLLPVDRLANERDGILTVVASRGCPLDCSFCANHAMRKLYRVSPARYARIKPVGHVIEEIRSARRGHPSLWAVFFHDDIFGLSRPWLEEMLARYPEEVDLPFGVNLVIDQVTPTLVARLRHAGCRLIQLGIESGSAYIRNEVIGKGIPEVRIREVLDLCRAAGIMVKLFALIGVPEERGRHLVDSFRGFARFMADMVQVQVWIAHEGSRLNDRDRDQGRIALRQYDPRGDRAAWRLKFYFRWFHRYVALYHHLDAWRARHPVRARVVSALVGLSVRFRWAPDLLLARDWDGRRRLPARYLESRWGRAAARRLLGRDWPALWAEVRATEERLAADYIVPDDLETPAVDGWRENVRRDRRLAAVQA